MVFEESRVLIRDSILRFATLLNKKLDLLGLCFIIAMILGCCLNFSMIFSKGSWICSTLANSSSLHCKPRDRTIFAKKIVKRFCYKVVIRYNFSFFLNKCNFVFNSIFI